MLISPEIFFKWKDPRTIIDLRPANSFTRGSFDGAISLPAEKFQELGILQDAISETSSDGTIHLVDHDGSLVAVLSKKLQIPALSGGYKNFKNWRDDVFTGGPPIGILGGKTGSGKTESLKELILLNRQVVDLEEMSVHRGSVFGSFENQMQPLYENFQNRLLEIWLSFNPSKPVWLEEKGAYLGRVGLPHPLYDRMCSAIVFELDVPVEERLNHIVNEYGGIPQKSFEKCIRKLESRIGMSVSHKVLHLFINGQKEKCFELLLQYYDEAYNKKREDSKQKGGVLKISRSVLTDKNIVDELEKQIICFHKMKDPAAFTAGTLLM